MSTWSIHKRLQRLAQDEFGKRPQLLLCHRLLQENPSRAEETTEEWISRVALANETELRESADRKEANK